MSGGHWDYGESWKAARVHMDGTLKFIEAAEHELDWGICCDTCLECAKKRVAEGLIRLFDGDVDAAVAIARDQEQNRCDRHEKEDA